MIFPISCILAGLVLGQRLKVLVLIPFTVLVLALVFMGGWALGNAPWPTAFTALIGALGLQAGYAIGLLARHLLAAPPSSPAPLTQAPSKRRPAH
jgi:hypothetical protein